MFAYQNNLFSVTVPCNRESFESVCRSAQVNDTIAKAREALARGDTKTYDSLKRSLPAFSFMCTFVPNKGAKGDRQEACWRLQKAAKLNGLVMLDYDHLEQNPREVFAAIPSHWLEDDCDMQILYAALTCSGQGLRLVCKADAKRGNLADNQEAISTALGLTCDKSIKNADRLSFANAIEDIIYINNEIFTYDNEEYDKMFGDNYRMGSSRPTKSTRNTGKSSDSDTGRDTAAPGLFDGPSAPLAQPQDAPPQPAPPVVGNASERCKAGSDTLGSVSHYTASSDTLGSVSHYRGVAITEIAEAWLKANGIPEQGERHLTMVRAACDLRYICDNNAEQLAKVLITLPFIQDIVKERGEEELKKACEDACAYPMKPNLPKAVKDALKVCKAGKGKDNAQHDDGKGADNADKAPDISVYTQQWEQLKPLMGPLYELATYRMDDLNKMGGVFMAGAMFCTLLTRCWYRHYDGDVHRMNPQVYIIGDPASGKGEGEKIDRIIMAPMLAADQMGRAAEAEYKKQQKERATSSKAQKGEALKRPEFCIRYLPSRTSNAVFFRRAKNAFEEVDGERRPLHLYTFDSELDGNTTAQSGGAWIGKHDIELKAFHNEFTGVDFANADSVNEIIQVFYNSVVTGTPISLGRKINLRNVNDGLCSRIAVFQMTSNRYQMIGRGNPLIINEKNCQLKQWAFKFDKLQGELKIERLVNHVYGLCEQAAYEAEASSDRVLDYLRKRAVFYATWLTVPRIVARAINDFEATDEHGGTRKNVRDVATDEHGGTRKNVRESPCQSVAKKESPLDCVAVQDDDLEFATLMFRTVIYWQDYFFGTMLEESWDNAERDFKPRKRGSVNSASFALLKSNFTVDDVATTLNISYNAAKVQAARWAERGYVKRIKQGLYEKSTSTI